LGSGKRGWEGKGEGEGEGGSQYTSNLGPEWTRIAPHTKEGFQVSKRDRGKGEGFSRQRGIITGDRQGVIKGIVPCASDIMPTCTYRAFVCVCCANKELCLGCK
jgi:hypothetical protein